MKKIWLLVVLGIALPTSVLIAQLPESVHLGGIPFALHFRNTPLSFRQQHQSVTLVAGPKTDMFRDPNVTYNTDNAPKLLFQPDSDFVFTVAIEHSFASKWDGGAIVLWADDHNWIKFCYEKDYTGARRVVTVVTRDISDDCNSAAYTANKIWYKIAKAGKVITLYCSQDGHRWLLVRHCQFEAPSTFYLGFLAQSPTGQQCPVTFSNWRYEAKTIKDPYTGK